MTAKPGFGAKAAQQAMAFLTSLLENDEVKEETRLKAAGSEPDRDATAEPLPEQILQQMNRLMEEKQ